jgi:hypothetical protein
MTSADVTVTTDVEGWLPSGTFVGGSNRTATSMTIFDAPLGNSTTGAVTDNLADLFYL